MSAHITKTWNAGSSCQLVIPREMAAKHKLIDTDVVFIEAKDGLLLKRLEL